MEQDATPSTSALSYQREKNAGCGRGCLAPFFGIFLLAGAAMFYALTVQPLWGILSARNWVETPCKITSSQVAVHNGDDGDTYSIEIRFEYTYDGRQFSGDRYHFMEGFSSGGRSGKQAIVDQYPVGAQRTCFVDPGDPSQAVIQRGMTADLLWGLLSLPFLAVGVGGVWFVVFGRRLKNARASGASRATSFGGASLDLIDGQGTDEAPGWEPDGPVVLRPNWSPLAKFLGMTFVALFWNGITSIFVFIAVQSFQKGRPEWFLTVFITPFVLIGVGLILGVVYSFLSLFNPRPTLVLSRAKIPLGESAELSWKFARGAGAIRRVQVTLRGKEKATYRRGTSTYTDEEAFHTETIHDTTDPFDIREGRAEIRIPTDAMHSFQAPNNQIAWSIQFTGEVGLWPDVNSEFPLNVTPHEQFAD